MKSAIVCFAVLSLALIFTTQQAIATVPFIESFTSSASNWADGPGTNFVGFVASGGPDGSSYVSTSATAFNLADDAAVVLFRGQDEFNSSAHAFEGNWITSGINKFSVYVRHDAPVSLQYFVRFATPSNFPGTAAEKTTSVNPNVWTQLTFDIVPSNINVELFPEGPPSFYNSTFSNVGHIQVGYSVPVGFGANSNSYTFGMDQVSIDVPEPASWLLVIGAAAGTIWRRRRTQ